MKFNKLVTGMLIAAAVITAAPAVTQNTAVISEAAVKKKNIGSLSFAIADPGKTINEVYDTGDFTAMHIVEVNAVFVPKDQKAKHKYTLYEITGGKKNKIIDLKYRSKKKSLKLGIGDGTMFSYTRKFGIRCPFQNSDKFQKFVVMDEKGRKSEVCEHMTLLDIGDHDESITTAVYLKNKDGKWIKQRSYRNTWIDTVQRDKDYIEDDQYIDED